MLGGLLTTALGLVLVGRADSVWVLFTSYALMGAGFAATSVIPASHLVALWFTRRRTVAMSLVFVGLPVGGAVFTPPVAWLVESRGIEGASPLLAAGLLAIGAPMTLLLGPRTSEQPLPGSDPEDVGTPFGGAVRSRWFVLVTAALSLGMLSQLGLLAHLYHAVETRIDAPTAAWALSLTAASSLVGRLVASWALTRLRLKDFRNYETVSLDLDGRHVCLYGSNGAGKTNLLEAVSQLGPGRGLRSATLADLTRHDADTGWTVSATVDDQKIGVGLETDGNTSKRIIRIDGAPSQASDLADLIRIVWLTPAMDGVFRGGASDRRSW